MAKTVLLHFHNELNDFIEPKLQKSALIYQYDKARSVKDLVESLGVPHPEIRYLVANHKSVDFSYLVTPEDRIDVYPTTACPDITPLIDLQEDLPGHHIFVLDVHLGKLASYLRLYGFDTLYQNDLDDPELAEISFQQNRILLTCDRRLLMRSIIKHGYFVRSRNPEQQLDEVVNRYRLAGEFKLFSRCMNCNGRLEPVEKKAIASQLLPKTREHYDHFYQCKQCGKIYWEGSHVNKLKEFIRTRQWT